MTQNEVAHELRVARGTVRNLIDDRLLVGVKINHRKNAAVRVTRESFEAYCERIEAEYAARLGGAA
jgi:DNA-binding transcriptional regulator LsrR (DeoR family)